MYLSYFYVVLDYSTPFELIDYIYTKLYTNSTANIEQLLCASCLFGGYLRYRSEPIIIEIA